MHQTANPTRGKAVWGAANHSKRRGSFWVLVEVFVWIGVEIFHVDSCGFIWFRIGRHPKDLWDEQTHPEQANNIKHLLFGGSPYSNTHPKVLLLPLIICS